MSKKNILFSFCAAILLSNAVHAEEKFKVHEGLSSLEVRTTAPIPSEVENETQARALSRDAAIVMGQDALLMYILQKKTHSKRTLAVAEIPSIELQQTIRGYVKGARVAKTQWTNKECHVTLNLSKHQLNHILRQN